MATISQSITLEVVNWHLEWDLLLEINYFLPWNKQSPGDINFASRIRTDCMLLDNLGNCCWNVYWTYFVLLMHISYFYLRHEILTWKIWQKWVLDNQTEAQTPINHHIWFPNTVSCYCSPYYCFDHHNTTGKAEMGKSLNVPE